MAYVTYIITKASECFNITSSTPQHMVLFFHQLCARISELKFSAWPSIQRVSNHLAQCARESEKILACASLQHCCAAADWNSIRTLLSVKRTRATAAAVVLNDQKITLHRPCALPAFWLINYRACREEPEKFIGTQHIKKLASSLWPTLTFSLERLKRWWINYIYIVWYSERHN